MIFGTEMVEKILEGSKTETRRWHDPSKPCRYSPGGGPGGSYAVQPGRGKHAVARIRVVEVGLEPLGMIDEEAARREGFAGVEEFRGYWRGLHGWWNPSVFVWVIRFELVPRKKGGASLLALGAGAL